MGNKSGIRLVAVALAAAALIVPVVPTLAAASEPSFAQEWRYTPPANVRNGSAIPPGSLILNSSARTGFQFFETESRSTIVRIIDLDDYRIRFEVSFDEKPITARYSAGYMQYHHALDEEKNELYIPYTEQNLFFAGVLVIDGNTGEISRRLTRLSANDPTRAVDLRRTPPAGPEDVGVCTSASCLPQTIGLSPTVDALEFTPSYVSGSKPKVLMLWTEPMAPGLEGVMYVSWVTQWDAETGRQDFSYRVQSCSTAYPIGGQSAYPLTIFQARLGAGIYVGCNAPGSTGQVVRIRLDANGLPNGEDAYPGPQNVIDAFGDRQTDRLIFRVSVPEGETYWVFNGISSNYTGVVAATLSQVRTRTAIDPASGRLYVMAADSQRGRQSQPAAFLMTDLRRNPVPQMTRYPDLFLDGIDTAPVVDAGRPSGLRRIIFHRQGRDVYDIIEDPLPVSEDPLLTDVDRFTVDVEEAPGTTAANFTGTGHAYGLRVLMAGGLRAAVPNGATYSGLTIRNVTAPQFQSPCLNQDREIAVGSVPFTNLAGNLASAEAAAATTEAGTIGDAREPTGRCHPTVIPGAVGEPPRVLPEDADRDGQSQADETLGTEWPFRKAQCSGQGQDEQVTTLKPLDRDPVPNEFGGPQSGSPADDKLGAPRETALRLEDNRASVRCGQLEERTDADATAAAIKAIGLPPGVDSIDIGSVGSFSRIVRIQDLGLVSETVAYVRDVSIGGRISIDLAYSRARAWAAGRPGTAGTSLERRVCGVAIPEISGRYSVIPIDSPGGDLPPDPEPIPAGDPAYDATRGTQNPVDGGDGVSYPIGNVDPLSYGDDDQNIDGAIKACSEVPEQASAASGTPLGSQPFLEVMNRVLGARGKASIPEPDRELRQGSPGGYLASIQKDRYQQIGSRTVSNDGSTQVPAFEIQLYNDDPQTGRGRQLFQFAGVDASVTYGIYLLNPEYPSTSTDTPGDDLPPWDITDDLIDFTGGPELPPIYQPPTTTPPVPGFMPTTYLYRGAVFLSRSWQDAGLAASVLILLAGPAILLGRRRGLRSLI